MATVQLGAKAVGSLVKLKENGVPVEYLVVHQGLPSAMYDASCNGTWLLRKDIFENQQWHSSKINNYAASTIKSYLDNTFFKRIDAKIQSVIKQVKIPFRPGSGLRPEVNSGTSGLSCKVFLLSGYEMGWTNKDELYFPPDGAKLAYFDAGTSITANNKRIAKIGGGGADSWWLRSPHFGDLTFAWTVHREGRYNNYYCVSSTGVRPAMIMPTTLKVLDDGTIITNQPPAVPSSLTLPATIKSGPSFAISWPAASDQDGNLAGYKLERSYNGNGVWTQVYQGGAAKATDMIPYGVASNVQYRVKAYDTEGAESGWYTSATKPVVNNQAPSAPPSITVPLAVTGGERLLVSWAASTDREGNLSGYILERQVAGGAWATVYTGPVLSFLDTITKGWKTVAYRVKAYDALGDQSPLTTSPTRTVDNNSPPAITCAESGSLGEKTAGFAVSYSASDPDGDQVTVTEAVDGKALRTFQAQAGTEYSLQVEGQGFMALLNGEHALTMTAKDSGGKTTALKLTFTKAVHALKIGLPQPMNTAALVTKMVMNVVRSIPADAQFQVLVTNNPHDPEPVWEDATASIGAGLNYLFTNTTVANTPGFDFTITASRGESGQGGWISSIGGAFE